MPGSNKSPSRGREGDLSPELVKGHGPETTVSQSRRGSASMGKSFARLFRASKFANYDPRIPRMYVPSKQAPETIPGRTTSAADRPAFFGFKRDLPPTHYGQPIRHVQVCRQDGRYGLSEIRDGAAQTRTYQVVSELQRLLGHSQGLGSDFQGRPMLFPEGLRIPGRVLNRLDNGGYAIGVGGVVAELPYEEIPLLQHFTPDDGLNRRAFYFYVKKASIDKNGKPSVILSLKPQH